ncbi:photoreceptor outer segment membrane glycoprotein 2 [Zophobas morio]|uniref:photoreceptor outer segment membrane glycoprotein 2 n=1 Tax=Zophobas morio TaxID=2755281 RepID=UPI0030832D37
MAVGVFKLSKSQRSFLSIIFLILNLIQVLTGVTMLSLSIYVCISVAPILFSERAELSYVFAVVAICGVNNICCWLFGLKIRLKCLNQASKKSTRSLVFAWICISFYVITYLIILARHTRKIYKHIIRAMDHSFYTGISKYLKDSNWKISIDKIQYDMQCCGAKSYKEWYEVPWLDKYQINVKSESVKQYRENGSSLYPVTPWSCCRLGFPMQCLHDPLQQTGAHSVWADQHSLTLDSLNTEGCINKLKPPIRWSLTGFILLVVVNCIVQLLIFIVVRLLYTSCRNDAILNDADGVAPGWIFGRGDCGYGGGKSLMHIMYPNSTERRRKSTSPTNDEENRLIDSHDN